MRFLIYVFVLFPSILSAQMMPQVYETPQSLDLRASPPNGGFWNFPGAIMSETDTETPYVVLKSQNVQQGFSQNQWIEIAPVSGTGLIDRSASGWVVLPSQSQSGYPSLTKDNTLSSQIIEQLSIELNQ